MSDPEQHREPAPRPRNRALQSAEAASILYDLQHLVGDKDHNLAEPLKSRPVLPQVFGQEEEDAAVAQYFANRPKKGAPRPRSSSNQFATRGNDYSDKILKHLNDEILLDRVLPALRANGVEYWFGFSEFSHFNDIGVVSRVVNYVENSTLDMMLVDSVFTPLIRERMGDAYPSADEFLLSALIRFAVSYLWDWKNPGNPDYLERDHAQIVTEYPGSESVIRRYLREATAVPNELRERLIRCNMLLQLVEKSKKTLVWGVPDNLVGMEPRSFMPIIASQPIGSDFSMYLRQVFISRQLRLMSSKRKRKHEEIQSVSLTKLDINGLMRNLDKVFDRLRFHYNTYSYFRASCTILCNRIPLDFENKPPAQTSMSKLMAWAYYTIDKTDFKVQECIKEHDDLLLAHVLCTMGRIWRISVRSRTSIPRQLTVHVPELAKRERDKKARRDRMNAVIEKNLSPEADREAIKQLQRDRSPKPGKLRQRPTDMSQLSKLGAKQLSVRLSSQALGRRPEVETGVFLSSSSGNSSSNSNGYSSSYSSGSGGMTGLLAALDRSSNAAPRPRIAVQPLRASEGDDDEAPVRAKMSKAERTQLYMTDYEEDEALLFRSRPRGRPKGSKNRPKAPNPNDPF